MERQGWVIERESAFKPKYFDLPPLEDERPPLSEEHECQRCRFLGIPYDPVAAEKLRGMRRWYIWNKRAMDARDKARGFGRQDNEPPASPGTPADEPDSGSDEQDSTHYWRRYPPD